ncbi:phosphorylated adapter RNA export protein-like [Argopecten irradians]|uniref:phosphorylated adapter RNA export protein-like n=1 Tax=Argopecten irradians TaxID=31199 RepID=UPI00372412FF
MADLEDGEIPDSDEEVPSTLPDSKKPDNVSMNFPHAGGDIPSSLAMAVRQPTSQPHNNHMYRNKPSHPPVDSEDDSSDTSDEDTDLWQCKKAKYFSKPRVQSMDLAHEITSPPRGVKPPSNDTDEDPIDSPQKKRKINNVWGAVITEQVITHSFKASANVDKNEDCDDERDVESYDYTKAYEDDRPRLEEQRTIEARESNDPFENVLDTIVELYDGDTKKADVESRKRKRPVKDRLGRKERKNVKDRLGERDHQNVKERINVKETIDDNEQKGVKDRLGQIDPNISRIDEVTDTDPEERVIKAITDMLDEPNTDLFGRIVSIVGRSLALKFAYQTKNVESAGGLLTNDGARRRTPGGVYIQLLKKSKDVTKEQTKEIFAEEELKYKREQRKMKRAKRRRQVQLRSMLPQSKYSSQKSKGDQKQDVEMGNENMPEVNDCNDDSDNEEGQLDISQEIEAAKLQQEDARKMDDFEFSLNDSVDVDIELG